MTPRNPSSSPAEPTTAAALFQAERNAELLIEDLQHYRAEGHYKLHAFVVMPDHIHLLLTPHETLERVVGLIKGGFSHRLASKLPVWQRGFTDHRIRDAADYSIRHHYIHQNPVTVHLCERPEAYLFSSAHRALQLDAYFAVEEAVPQGLKPHES